MKRGESNRRAEGRNEAAGYGGMVGKEREGTGAFQERREGAET